MDCGTVLNRSGHQRLLLTGRLRKQDVISCRPKTSRRGPTIQFPRSGLICATLVAASACAVLVKVRAEISGIQPFTAIHTQTTRYVELPFPNVSTQILAVSGDDQLLATLSRSDLPGFPV
jgi:hypothetical protein